MKKINFFTLLLTTTLFLFSCDDFQSGKDNSSSDYTLDIAALIDYSFNSSSSKLIHGENTKDYNLLNCNGITDEDDIIGNLTIVSAYYSLGVDTNGCYTDGKYNNRDYQVEKGLLTSTQNDNTIVAYKVYEPAAKASVFLASAHNISYKFPTKEDYKVYAFFDNKIEKLTTVSKENIDTSKFTELKINVSAIVGSKVFVFARADIDLSVYHELGENIEGAFVKKYDVGKYYKIRFSVSSTPFDTVHDFVSGPEDPYGNNRKFFYLEGKSSNDAVVFQDHQSKEIKLLSFSKQYDSFSEKTLKNDNLDILASVTNDDDGNIYYLTVQEGVGAPNNTRRVSIFKTNSSGKALLSKDLDASKSALNVTKFAESISDRSYVSSMVYSNKTLCVILTRIMHQSSDGLNHQGAIAIVLDTTKLSLIKNLGQTSGHSFGNYLLSNSSGEFIAIDLGDNYPRGINMHKISKDSKTSRVVYTFKTHHGESATSPAGVSYPEYTKITTAEKIFYKWSNDNKVYTELGGLVETTQGYLTFFAGENPSLDNSKTGEDFNDPRNLAFVHVVKDFDSISNDGEFINENLILSPGGPSEEGEFYTFNGSISKQRNVGVNWLTNYNSLSENVTHIKGIRLNNTSIALFWELWGKKADSDFSYYISSHAMIVDNSGKVKKSEFTINPIFRLNRQNDIYKNGKTLLTVAGIKGEKIIELNLFISD